MVADLSSYKKAYQSLTACPLTFGHPSEAQQLNGLGPKLCDRLSQKLEEHCRQNGLPMPSKTKNNKRSSGAHQDESEQQSPPRKVRKTQPYVPKLRSGAYAILLALATLDQESNQAISKDELIALAQPHCDASFTTPSDPTKFFTAWKSMQTLETKELVCTKGRPTKKYYLSDEGWEVATRMRATLEGGSVPPPQRKQTKAPARAVSPEDEVPHGPVARRPTTTTELPQSRPKSNATTNHSHVVDLLSSPGPDWLDSESEENGGNHSRVQARQCLGSTASLSEDTIVLPAGSFEVRMVLDMREIRTTSDRDYISGELKKHDVVPILRSLPLGDVLWIADVKPSHVDSLRAANSGDGDAGNSEVVLEHILERKRLDDLISSIKDGRFHEQKFRLHKSGIRNVTYLVEEYAISSERSDKYGDALESAIASMQVVDHFFVKQTSKLDDTIRYLARMTKTLKNLYETKDIHVIQSRNFEADVAATTLERFRKVSPEKIFGVTFSIFSTMCDKSESMTLRDVYLKMLMCTRGVTGEKAVEIQKIWPTPRALAEAFETREKGPQRDAMISDRLGNAIPRKKIAKSLSTKIAEIWG